MGWKAREIIRVLWGLDPKVLVAWGYQEYIQDPSPGQTSALRGKVKLKLKPISRTPKWIKVSSSISYLPDRRKGVPSLEENNIYRPLNNAGVGVPTTDMVKNPHVTFDSPKP